MLVLSRKPGESIQIGRDITIKLIRVSGGRVRLAIDAPATVRICRAEILEALCSPGDAAAGSPFDDVL